MPKPRIPLVVLAAVSTAWLAFLIWAYYTGHAGVRRHHLESRWIIHVALLTVAWLLAGGRQSTRIDAGHAAAERTATERATERASRSAVSASGAPPPSTSIWDGFGVPLLLCLAVAFALYGQTLNDGLLSDDFVLARRVQRQTFFVNTGTDFFRPIPLLLWRAIAAWTASPAVWWHALNVTLHGLTGALTYAVALRWRSSRFGAAGAALLFLTYPGHVEAVVWLSGIQDLAMTTASLLFVLTVSTPILTPRARFMSLAWLAAALLSKETGVAAVGLAALTLIQRRETVTRDHWRWWTVSAAITLVFIVWRMSTVAGAASIVPSFSAFGVKDFLAKPLSALGAPWSAADIQRSVAAVVLAIWMPLLLACRTVVGRERPVGRTWQIVGLLLWMVMAVAPAGRYFFVAPDLLGGRYLYLPAVAWAMLLMTLAETDVRRTDEADDATGRDSAIVSRRSAAGGTSLLGSRAARRAPAVVPLVLLAGLYVWGTLRHLEPWHRAGITRDRLLADVRTHAAREGCDRVAVDRIPGVMDGAFVFLNGLPEAVAMETGSRIRVEIPGADVPARCHLPGMAATESR